MKLRHLIALGTIFSCLWACNTEEPFPSNLGDENVIINTDSETLSLRINQGGRGVVGVLSRQNPTGRILSMEEGGPAGNLPLELVGQVAPPEYGGKKLQASHVAIEGKFAYVSYTMQGPEFLGAVEIFDISTLSTPKIVSQAIFKHADINAITYDAGKLYLAASVDIDQESAVVTAANMITVSTSNGQFTSEFTYSPLAGASGTDILHSSNKVLAASGTSGALTVFELPSGQMVKELELPDLRSVAYGHGKIAALDGANGVRFYDPVNFTETGNIPVEMKVAGAKRTMAVHDQHLLVSEGAAGVGVYDFQSGAMVDRLPIPVGDMEVATEDLVTNAVSTNLNHVYLANGGAGLSVSEYVKDKIEELGILEIYGSTNYVKVNEDYIFVASGNEGLQVIRIHRAEEAVDALCDGLPSYSGNANLNVNSNRPEGYSGAASLHQINVNDELVYCGALAVRTRINVNSDGVFHMRGNLGIGRQGESGSGLTVNGKMTVDGNLFIYGDLTINSGGTLEFLGNNSLITVLGKVTINNNGQVIGKFNDTEGKL